MRRQSGVITRLAAGLLALIVATPTMVDEARSYEAVGWSAVGRVNVAGRSFCTGTLIDPQRALTAAHCLFHPGTGVLVALDDIHFVAGWERGDFIAHAQPTAVHLARGYQWSERQAMTGLERDLAVLEFAEPVVAEPIGVLAEVEATPSLRLVHYSRTRPHLANVDEGCVRLGTMGNLWLVDCAVEAGGSGAPVLVNDGGALRVAAVVVGRTRHEDVWTTIAVPFGAPHGLPLP